MRKCIIVTMFLLISACSQRVVVQEEQQFYRITGKQYPYSAAIIISKEIKTLKESIKPNNKLSNTPSYTIDIGKPLSVSLNGSVNLIYGKVVEVDRVRYAQDYDRIIRFSKGNSALDIYYEEGAVGITTQVTYTVTLIIEAVDKDDTVLKRRVVSGKGMFSTNLNIHASRDKLSRAIETSILKVSEQVANLLASGFAEPENNPENPF